MKRRRSGKTIWIEDNFNVFPSKEDSYPCFHLFVENEYINELSYDELLMIRDMINRIEQRHKKEEVGAR